MEGFEMAELSLGTASTLRPSTTNSFSVTAHEIDEYIQEVPAIADCNTAQTL
jgi:hypothetical protein